jgi:hypothetical protein
LAGATAGAASTPRMTAVAARWRPMPGIQPPAACGSRARIAPSPLSLAVICRGAVDAPAATRER